MICKGFDPITEDRYLYCDKCGTVFDLDTTDFSHVCEAPDAGVYKDAAKTRPCTRDGDLVYTWENRIPVLDAEPSEACKVCGSDVEWVDCWQCGGEGYGDEFHDCGEDCCCCLDPEPGECPGCHGRGGYLECLNAERHHTEADPLGVRGGAT